MNFEETVRCMPEKVTEAFRQDVCMSYYENLVLHANEYGSDIALEYFFVKYTYDQLFQQIDLVSNALYASGIRAGDVVIVSLPCIPEGIFLFYAINKLGAVYCATDCRSSAEEIADTVEKTGAKLCFCANFHVASFCDGTSLPIVYIQPDHSLGLSAKLRNPFAAFFTGRAGYHLRSKNLISYDRFMKRSAQAEAETFHSDGSNMCCYMYTSGTTNGRKCVMLTNFNMLSAVYQQIEGNPPHKRGDVFMNVMPLFSCFGLSHGILQPLRQGIHIVIIPLFKPENMETLLKRHHPNYTITVPSHWDIYLKNGDPKYMHSFDCIIIGGDTLTPEFEDAMNDYISRGGSKAVLMNGYGMTEASACVTGWMGGVKSGSVANPFSMVLIDIIDPETDEILPPGEIGDICLRAPNACVGYLKDPEATSRLYVTHKDGITRLQTGDVGYLDRDNELFFCDRKKRMYVSYDGTKVSPKDVETILDKCPGIRRCMVTAINDPEHSHGMVGKAFIVPEDNISEQTFLEEVKRYANKHIEAYKRPVEYEIVSELPHTRAGKVDYMLTQQGG